MLIHRIRFPNRLPGTAAVGAAVLLMLTACAGISPVPAADDDGNRPRLLGCDYTPPPPSVGGANRRLTVRVRMSVSEQGRVTHATAERKPGYPASVVEAARRVAMSCRYEPATRDGVAIPFQTSRYFAFEVSG